MRRSLFVFVVGLVAGIAVMLAVDNSFDFSILGDNAGPGKMWDANAATMSGVVMIAPLWNDLMLKPEPDTSGIFVNRGADEITIRWRGREYDNPEWLLTMDNFQNVFKSQRFKIKPIGSVVISRYRLWITVDHDRLKTFIT